MENFILYIVDLVTFTLVLRIFIFEQTFFKLIMISGLYKSLRM